MIRTYRTLPAIFICVLWVCLSLLGAQSQAGSSGQNGAVDTKRDARAHGPTADQQKENASDKETTRKIRRAVYQDKSLSMMAHQVKIITVGGTTTLRGAVRSEEEKKKVEDAAAGVVGGADKVKSEITVSASNSGDAKANKAASKTNQE